MTPSPPLRRKLPPRTWQAHIARRACRQLLLAALLLLYAMFNQKITFHAQHVAVRWRCGAACIYSLRRCLTRICISHFALRFYYFFVVENPYTMRIVGRNKNFRIRGSASWRMLWVKCAKYRNVNENRSSICVKGIAQPILAAVAHFFFLWVNFSWTRFWIKRFFWRALHLRFNIKI